MTMPPIESHQIEWVFNAAHEHFRAELEKLESELLRHERFIDSPAYTAHIAGRQDRKERIEKCKHWMREYQKVMDWIAYMRKTAVEVGAKESAAGIVGYLQSKVPPLPKGKKGKK